jgi:cell division protein ZapA
MASTAPVVGSSNSTRQPSSLEQFGIDDKQDLLAMVAFDCLIDKMTAEDTYEAIDQTVFEKISQINHLVSQSIL